MSHNLARFIVRINLYTLDNQESMSVLFYRGTFLECLTYKENHIQFVGQTVALYLQIQGIQFNPTADILPEFL